MFWEVVKRLVDLSFLLLAIVMTTILWTGSVNNNKSFDFENGFNVLKEQIDKSMTDNLNYYENRINRLSRNVDDYQSSMSTRQDILEGKVKALELENKILKNQPKNINNNLNNNTVNIEK